MPALYDPEVTISGKILVGIENPSETSRPQIERALLVHSDILLKTI